MELDTCMEGDSDNIYIVIELIEGATLLTTNLIPNKPYNI